jgi:hypothetical protein
MGNEFGTHRTYHERVSSALQADYNNFPDPADRRNSGPTPIFIGSSGNILALRTLRLGLVLVPVFDSVTQLHRREDLFPA